MNHHGIAQVMVAATILVQSACTGNPGNAKSMSNLPQRIGPGEGALNLVAWSGYVESGTVDPHVDWVTPFEKQTGCKINVKFADTAEEMVTLMRQGGGTQWDGVSAGGDISNSLIAHGDVAEVNVDLISDFSDVVPALQAPRHNTIRGHHYGVPILYGPDVLMYNTKLVKPAPTSWKDTWDPGSPFTGKIVAFDSPIFIADAALYLKTHKPGLRITDIYELTSTQLSAAIGLLRQQAPMVKKYWASTLDETDLFSSGEVVLGVAWPFQVSFLKSNNKPVAAVVPTEGATGWADTWMMSSRARHPNCMYRWMGWTVRADIQDQVAEFYGGTPSNGTACDLLRRHIGASADADYHCGDNAFLKRIAFWTTPAQQCGDGRGATCTDYTVWRQRWEEMRGAS